jgi:hypothetical protein
MAPVKLGCSLPPGGALRLNALQIPLAELAPHLPRANHVRVASDSLFCTNGHSVGAQEPNTVVKSLKWVTTGLPGFYTHSVIFTSHIGNSLILEDPLVTLFRPFVNIS